MLETENVSSVRQLSLSASWVITLYIYNVYIYIYIHTHTYAHTHMNNFKPYMNNSQIRGIPQCENPKYGHFRYRMKFLANKMPLYKI